MKAHRSIETKAPTEVLQTPRTLRKPIFAPEAQDHVFEPRSTQAEVFEEIGLMALGCIS